MIEKKAIKTILWVISLCSLIGIASYLIKRNRDLYSKYVESTRISLLQKTYDARISIYEKLHTVITHIEDNANVLSQKDPQLLKKHLEKTAQQLKYVYAIGIAFEPYQYDSNEKRYSSYLVKENDHFNKIDIQKYYDYLKTDWYKKVFNGISQWTDPFTEVSTGTSVVRYVVPIFKFDTQTNLRKPIGVLFVDISRTELDLLANQTIGNSNSYGFILSQNDFLITHPIESYLTDYKTLSKLSQSPGKKNWHLTGNTIKRERGGITTYYDSVFKQSFWIAFEPLNIANWFFVYVTGKEDTLGIEYLRHTTLQIAIVFFLLFLFLSISLVYVIKLVSRRWIASSLIALSFLSLVFLQLYIASRTAKTSTQEKINSDLDLVRLNRFQKQRDKQLRKPDAIYIPTGVTINTILVGKENKIDIEGIIWQKYGPHAKKLKKEISFFKTGKLTLKELYRVENDDILTIGWSFQAVINCVFDKAKYPFNIMTLRIYPFHPEFEQNIILVPDFDSYEEHEVIDHTGISENLILESSWNIKNSYFSYIIEDNNSDFGISNAIRKEDFPNLSFAVDIKQGIINPLIGYLLPLIIIAFILFYVLIESDLSSKKYAFRTQVGIIGQIAGLFLALVFAHQASRNNLKDVAYLECFYFIMYAFTFLIATKSMYISKTDVKKSSFMFRFRENMKYMYWPLMMATIFTVTLYFFY